MQNAGNLADDLHLLVAAGFNSQSKMTSSLGVHFKEGTFVGSEADSSYNYQTSEGGSAIKWNAGDYAGT